MLFSMTTTPNVSIEHVAPTVFLRAAGGGRLEQLVRVTIDSNAAVAGVTVVAVAAGREVATTLAQVPAGRSEHEAFAPAIDVAGELRLQLRIGDRVLASKAAAWGAPRHWTVHLTHVSHHDAGYTDLFSNVLREHDRFLASAIEFADATRDEPDESQFRLVVEQAWSILHFLDHAPAAQVKRMEALLKSGHIELTAWFGNMVSHLCGHETLIRALYPAYALRQRLGIDIISAEHNDVPGMSWGMAEAMIDAGVKVFLPDLPHYWDWGDLGFRGFWDAEAIFGHGGPAVPEVAWWQAPSGRRLLMWLSNEAAAKDHRSWLPQLAPRLQELTDQDWPFDVFRCHARGGARDNAPYCIDYTRTVREWNQRWAFPRLICSTNARFYHDLVKQLPDELPVLRGELPDQDYPVGATSTAKGTAINRVNHIDAPMAESLASFASLMTDYRYPDERLAEIWRQTLWHDEHTWGTGGPRFGPGPEASEIEKALHAYQAMTLAYDVKRKAAARIADHVRVDDDDYHMIVFNTLAHERSAPVAAPLWEMENCGSEMIAVEESPGRFIRSCVNLTDRYSIHLPDEMIDGQFDLIDVTTGERVPFQVDHVTESDEPIPYAARRDGTGRGGKRLGMLEKPAAVARTLRFVARDLPACGYRTYRLAPRTDAPQVDSSGYMVIENEHYRIEADAGRGVIASIIDKHTGRELIDHDAPHSFGSLIVRDPSSELAVGLDNVRIERTGGPIRASIVMRGSIVGHPQVCQAISLTAGLRRIEVATTILKDATSLLDVHMAFPFRLNEATFRYDGVLGAVRPIADHVPGAYTDALAVQNWVKASDAGISVLWSSLDGPVAGLGGLWPGYVSPAHRAVIGERMRHAPLTEGDMTRGWIYAQLFNNNFGTNFAINQTGEFLFRHVITTRDGDIDDASAAVIGEDMMTAPEAVMTNGERHRPLAPSASMMRIDHPAVRLLAWKRAEDSDGWIVRLWNVSDAPATARVHLPNIAVASARPVTAMEEPRGEAIACDGNSFTAELEPRTAAAFRVVTAVTG